MSRDLRDADWSEVYGTNDVNIAWKAFYKITSALFDSHAPMINKPVKSKPAPWLTAQIKALMNDRDKLYRKYRRSKLDYDRRAYQDKRNQVNTRLRKARSNYNKDLLRESSNDPDKFWKTLKSIYPTSQKGNPQCKSFDINGEKCTDAKQIANGFRSFFSTAVNHIKSQAMHLTNFAWRKQINMIFKTYKTFSFKEVTPVEIYSLIKQLKKKKSTGCDNLPVVFLKDAKDEIKEPLAYIINLSMRNGVVPTGWKTARITPVYKSGPRSQFNNYRPISILPIVSKIAERIVHKQLMNFLEENNLLYSHQFGFRKGMSTEQAVTLFLDEIRSNVDKGKLTGACFIDLSKAFDTISHAKLLTKLPKYGIHDIELEWFTDYLFNRNAIVQFEQEYSESFSPSSGVPQGSILGPLLFLIIFNDLTDVIEYSKVIKYADDTVLFVSGKTATDITEELNRDLSRLDKWFHENELIMNLNKGKTEALLFGTAKKVANGSSDFRPSVNDKEITKNRKLQVPRNLN